MAEVVLALCSVSTVVTVALFALGVRSVKRSGAPSAITAIANTLSSGFDHAVPRQHNAAGLSCYSGDSNTVKAGVRQLLSLLLGIVAMLPAQIAVLNILTEMGNFASKYEYGVRQNQIAPQAPSESVVCYFASRSSSSSGSKKFHPVHGDENQSTVSFHYRGGLLLGPRFHFIHLPLPKADGGWRNSLCNPLSRCHLPLTGRSTSAVRLLLLRESEREMESEKEGESIPIRSVPGSSDRSATYEYYRPVLWRYPRHIAFEDVRCSAWQLPGHSFPKRPLRLVTHCD
uniref:Uncharacterized protein n=1 Tax=Anopheles atroparvus TaxID=41427 RepID=A0A182JGF5_ANOAO